MQMPVDSLLAGRKKTKGVIERNKMAKVAGRCKDLITIEQDARFMKERDNLLHEFLLAREDLQRHYDEEKAELINYYERRIQYLKKAIDKGYEETERLKFALDTEKEDNLVLKVKIVDLQRELESFANQGYKARGDCLRDSNVDTQHQHADDISRLEHTLTVGGLNYRHESPIGTSSESLSESTSSSDDEGVSTLDQKECYDLHKTCREEFNELLLELRNQTLKYEAAILKEREKMAEHFNDERLQLEKVVYRQLNLRLQKELKRRELLQTENAHLHKTISKTILDKICKNGGKIDCPDDEIKECNSDSGADVGDNGSDNGDRLCDKTSDDNCSRHAADVLVECGDTQVTKGSAIADQAAEQARMEKALQEQRVRLRSEYQRQLVREKRRYKQTIDELNAEIVALVKENRWLKNTQADSDSVFHDVDDFHLELTQKLVTLQYILDEGDINE